MIKYRQKVYTMYDSTDALKKMRDSDILAEKKKSNSGLAASTLGAGAIGAGLGAVGGAVVGGLRKGHTMKGGAKWGAALGAAGALAAGMAKNRKQRKENNFYNDRLAYAQRQAKRREKADWKQNMTGREGYTY